MPAQRRSNSAAERVVLIAYAWRVCRHLKVQNPDRPEPMLMRMRIRMRASTVRRCRNAAADPLRQRNGRPADI